MRQVIFVGGSSYSGSTMFDLTLGNDPSGFSCGETYAYLHPYRSHHVYPECSCGNPDCAFWATVKQRGEDRIYETIFKLKPEIQFIVDSSKDPFWIDRQSKILDSQGIKTRNILIWKTPGETAQSFRKRGTVEHWEKTWVNYHRLYYSLIGDWKAIRYARLVTDGTALERICAFLNIPYFKNKEKYWEKTQHLIFGNESARIYLQRTDPLGINSTGELVNRQRPRIYFHPVTHKGLLDSVRRRERRSPYISKIRQLLQQNDVLLDDSQLAEHPEIKMNIANIQLRKSRRHLSAAFGKLRYRR